MTRLHRILVLVSLAAAAAADGGDHLAPAANGSIGSVGGALILLLTSIIQLAVGLGIAAFAINHGLALVAKMLGGLDIWAEIKKKNLAVALLAAGAVISYANVIGSGIESLTGSFATLFNGGGIRNVLLGLLAGIVNLIVAIGVASFTISVTFKIMERMTKDVDEKAELSSGNTAIGILYCGILIGVGFLVSNGVNSIGKGLYLCMIALGDALGFA